MRRFQIVSPLLALCVALGSAYAEDKKPAAAPEKKGENPAAESAATAEAAKDAKPADEKPKEKSTVKLTDDESKLAYALGVKLGEAGNNNRFKVDSKALWEAVEGAIKGAEPKFKPEEIQKISMELGQKLQQPGATLSDEESAKASTLIGSMAAATIKQLDPKVTIEALKQGADDLAANKELAISQEECQQIIADARKKQQTAQREEMAKKGEAAKKEGEEYLAKNKTKEGVKSTPSGLQYEVIKEGQGDSPAAADTVKVHYKGTLTDGSEFDSSYARNEPAQFPLNGVIKGWTEGLQLMKPGAKYKFTIPSELGYGARGMGAKIPPNSVLVFEVELLEVTKAEKPAAEGSTITLPTEKPAEKPKAE